MLMSWRTPRRAGAWRVRAWRSAAGEGRQDVDDRALGEDQGAVAHGHLVEQEAGGGEHAGERVAVVGGERRDQVVYGGACGDGDVLAAGAGGGLGPGEVPHGDADGRSRRGGGGSGGSGGSGHHPPIALMGRS